MLKNRLTYVMVAVVLFLFIYLQEHHMTYMAFYAILIMPILSFGITALSKNCFFISGKLSADFITKDQKAIYTFKIHNRSFLPCSLARLRFESCDIGLKVESKEKYFSLLPYKKYEFDFQINGIYRGVYDVGIKDVVYYDFLGLFRFKLPLSETYTLTIMPRIISIDNLPMRPAPQDNANSSNHIQGEDYSNISELREFQLTDSYRQIHWKASAKRGKLISKNFHEEDRQTVTFFIDNKRVSPDLLKAFNQEDKMMEIVVSAMYYCYRDGYFISMHLIDEKQVDLTVDFTHLYQKSSRIQFSEKGDLNVSLSAYLNSKQVPMNLFIFINDVTNALLVTLQSLLLMGNEITIFLPKSVDDDIQKLRILDVHLVFIDDIEKYHKNRTINDVILD